MTSARRRYRRPCNAVDFPHGLAWARLYPSGTYCDLHSPAARAGRPEPQPGPGWPPGALIHQQTADGESAPDEGTEQ